MAVPVREPVLLDEDSMAVVNRPQHTQQPHLRSRQAATAATKVALHHSFCFDLCVSLPGFCIGLPGFCSVGVGLGDNASRSEFDVSIVFLLSSHLYPSNLFFLIVSTLEDNNSSQLSC